MSRPIAYTAPPTVGRFMRSNAFARCIVGPLGSGKSSGCVMEILRRAREQRKSPDGFRYSRWGVVRNTFRVLRDTTRRTFSQWIPEDLGKWREADNLFELRFGDVRAEVLFRAMDTPADVKKLLSLELTGCYFNELREIPKEIWDGMQGRVGRYPAKIDGGPTWRGIWADTNPWHTGHWGHKLFSQAAVARAVDRRGQRLFELFEQPGGRSAGAENTENLPEDYYDILVHGKDAEWISVYVDGQYGVSDRGSVYGHLLDALTKRGGVGAFEHPRHDVFVTFDLGRSDATAMWFWRIAARPNGGWGIDFIDCYQSHGKAIDHYWKVLDSKGYKYTKFWLPHDARQHTVTTEQSTFDRFAEQCRDRRWGDAGVSICPSIDVADGIGALRWVLEQDTRFHARCDATLEGYDYSALGALRQYRYEFDEATKTYSKNPVHDWSSHISDSARYLAVVAKLSEFLTRKAAPVEKKPRLARMQGSVLVLPYSLEDIWETQKRSGRERIG